MKSARWLVLMTVLLTGLAAGLFWLTAQPAQADTPTRAPQLARVQPGNYCVSCHTPGDARLTEATAWQGSIDRTTVIGCGAAGQVQEQIYYTERLLLAIDRARAGLPARVDAAAADTRLAKARQSYSRLLDAPVNTLDSVSAEAALLRYQLGKSYRWLNQARETVKRQWVLGAAMLVTLVVLGSLGWSRQTIARLVPQNAGAGKFRPNVKAVIFIGVMFVLFALPIFRVPVQETAAAGEVEQARQTALDTANRVADSGDRALARAWMLARIGAAWHKLNPAQAETALTAALTAANEAQLDTAALWGEAQSAQEGAIGALAAQETAGLRSAQLAATYGRAWALRLIAAEWAAVDPARAAEILQQALETTAGQSGLYRELDVRAIAVTWATIDPAQAVAVAERVYDPALKTWALWEIAQITGDASLYAAAAESARQVADPVSRARSLREVAVHSGDKALFAEALAALDKVDGLPRAYALSDLAAAARDGAIAGQIDPAYPDALAAALYRLGQFEPAWAAAANIADPFDRARAQAAIAGAWANAGAAQTIADPTLRDLALRDVAIAKNDAALAATIELPYYRVQALTALQQYQAAFDTAAGLGDVYPLRALAVAWAKTDPQAALKVVDLMSREVDKAEALRAVAAATGDEALFERALNLALAARVGGDALAPAEASVQLAHAFNPTGDSKAETALTQAFEIAERMSVKYK